MRAARTSGTVGELIEFDGSASSDPDGTIASYAWDFGDGSTGTGATPTHAYLQAGTFTVALTVTDNQGATLDLPRPPTSREAAGTSRRPATRAVRTRARSASDASSTARRPTDPDGTIDVLRLGLR